MSILDTLVIDRTEQDVERLKTIFQKGLPNMSADEYQYLIRGELEVLEDSVADDLVDANGLTIQSRDGVLPKGAYNYQDLNRVIEAVEYVTELIRSAGYAIDDPVPVKSGQYTVEDIPTVEQMEIYLENVERVKNRLPLVNIRYPSIPSVPADMERLLPNEANDIEKILPLIPDTVERIEAERLAFFSGELYGGEV